MEDTTPTTPITQTPKTNWLLFSLVGIVILTIGVGIGLVLGKYSLKQISSYEDCLKAKGSRVQESNPPTCVTAKGLSFKGSVSSPAFTPDPTANWKTYVNKKYGYQIKYPNDWKSAETDDPGLGNGPLTHTIITSDAVPLKDSGFIGISIDRKLTWNQFIKNAKQQGFQNYKFNGQDAMIFKKDGYDTSIYLNSPADKLIIVTYGFSHDNFDKETIDQILSTFKFINETGKLCQSDTDCGSGYRCMVVAGNVPVDENGKEITPPKTCYPKDAPLPQ